MKKAFLIYTFLPTLNSFSATEYISPRTKDLILENGAVQFTLAPQLLNVI